MTTGTFDQITQDDLRAAGSLKWTTFPDMIGAFVAEMDFGLAPAVSTAVKDALDLGVTGYLPEKLAKDLSQATARWYSDSAIIVPTPAYMPFLLVPPMRGRRVIEVPSVEVDGRWVMDLDAVAQAFRDGGEMLVLCNPHNPLGTVATRDELLAIASVVTDAGGRVFSDEIHAPIVYAPAQHIPYASISDAAATHTLTATSASKAWNLAGLKCAQVILSNDADAALWASLGFWAGHGTSTLGVVANIAAYTGGREWLDGVVDYLDGNRRMLAQLVDEKLPGVRMIVPEGSYIALLDFRETGLTGDLGEWFREHAGVAMTDGAACGEAAIGYTRFVFALPRPVMVEAVDRIAAALRDRTA